MVSEKERAAPTAGGGDARPANCRNRQRDEGKPYPRSGCDHCRDGGLRGCPFELAALRALEKQEQGR